MNKMTQKAKILITFLTVLATLTGCEDSFPPPGESHVLFTNETYAYGNVNGAPNGAERPFCSCSVLFEDYDGDGDTDIFAGNHETEDVIYENSKGLFQNIAPLIGLADPVGMRAAEGSVFGDIDNDGDLDLYILSGNRPMEDEGGDEMTGSSRGMKSEREWETDSLFLNGKSQTGVASFTAVSDLAGIVVNTIPCGITFLDIDNDGWIDLYRQGHHDQTVYKNLGGGMFQDVTESMGVGDEFDSDAMGIATSDFDSDGDLDIFIGGGPEEPGMSGANILLRNDGNRFVDVAPQVGLDDPDSTFSAAWGDYDNDGDIDIYTAKNGLYGTPSVNTLYRNDGKYFTDVTSEAQVGDDSISTGAVFADFDNDGYLDIYVLNGTGQFGNRDTLYFNNRNGTFTDMTEESGLGKENRSGYALTVGDVNSDGFLDVYTGNYNNQLNELWVNGGNGNHWIEIKLEGLGTPGGSNRSGIGARVEVSSDGIKQIREVTPSSPGNHLSLILHFGLESETRIDEITVFWPGGKVQKLEDISSDRILTIYEQ